MNGENSGYSALTPAQFGALVAALRQAGYAVAGPRVADGEFVFGAISSSAGLAAGYADEQKPGRYLLSKSAKSAALFGVVNGQQSWKKYLFAQQETLWRARGSSGVFSVEQESCRPAKTAFLGVRPCDIAAIRVQDAVFTGGSCADTYYKTRRENVLIIAANCTRASGNCFCDSMGSGPRARAGFDLAFTEVAENGAHYFVFEAATAAGKQLLAKCGAPAASAAQTQKADALIESARAALSKKLDAKNIKALLYRNYENPRWEQTAKRCLACANCTMVCPTCFCSTMEDHTSLDGAQASRARRADSCFTLDFSWIHGGGSVRPAASSRYRQWMTHKLATWHDQFGTSGCVGCGRCITWCPVGIDITEEAAAIAEAEAD